MYKPHWKAILKLYRSKYTKAGKLEDEEELLEELLRLDAEEEVAALAAQDTRGLASLVHLCNSKTAAAVRVL